MHDILMILFFIIWIVDINIVLTLPRLKEESNIVFIGKWLIYFLGAFAIPAAIYRHMLHCDQSLCNGVLNFLTTYL